MTTLGKYELHEQLGRGGFGTVYRAVDAPLQREVALKVLHPQLTTDPDFLERFQNEARLTASLDNPHIVGIYELAEIEGRVFIAMEYLPGGSLKQRLENEGAIPFPETLKIINDICNGLQEAHEKGLVHRDVKPANILFDKKGRAVIGDFGLARAVQLSSSSASSSAAGGAGTPAYRAPELWNGKPPASPATDVYSLGCVLYEMLTGKVLIDGGTPEEALIQHLLKGPSLPERFPEGVPAGVRAVLEKALAKDQGERYRKVYEFVAALERCGKKTDAPETDDPEKEKRVRQPRPAAVNPEIPLAQDKAKMHQKWPWKKIGIIAGVAAALGLGIWLGGLSGNGPADSTVTEEPQALASTEKPMAIQEPTRTKTTKPTSKPIEETSSSFCPPLPESQLTKSGYISDVSLAKGTDGQEKNPINLTSVFAPTDVFHAVAEVENAPEATSFSATWYVTDVGPDFACNSIIDSTKISTFGTRNLDFQITPNNQWPIGIYRVEVKVNGMLDTVKEFRVR